MLPIRRSRLAPVLAVAIALALPGAAVAADSAPVAPPAPVVEWQTPLEHMQAMDGAFGTHLRDCLAIHGLLAGQLGPNGTMVEMMGEMVR